MSEPDSDRLLALARRCVHCGMCLPACPTYGVFGTEMDGPRGRIVLAQAYAGGEVPFDDPALNLHLSRCLDCRACEVACPSGVEFGNIVEMARASMAARRRSTVAGRLARRLVFGRIIPSRAVLRGAACLLWFYQRSGLQRVARRLQLVPAGLRDMEQLLPSIHLAWPKPTPARDAPSVAFFAGCVQDAFLSRVNRATVSVLEKQGYQVVIPAAQSCCGALHEHTDEHELALVLARRNVDAFRAAGAQAVIVNAGGCGAHLKAYGRLLAGDPVYAEAARAFAAQVYDLSEFLDRSSNAIVRHPLALRVTYADSCHLRNAQRVVDAPRRLIQAIPGIEYLELAAADKCCGSAGVYNLTQPDIAARLLSEKVANILATGAEVVVTTNSGCHFQIQAGLRKAGSQVRVMHLAELLDESYLVEEARHAAR